MVDKRGIEIDVSGIEGCPEDCPEHLNGIEVDWEDLYSLGSCVAKIITISCKFSGVCRYRVDVG